MERELSSSREGLSGVFSTERESFSRRKTEERKVPRSLPNRFQWFMLCVIGVASVLAVRALVASIVGDVAARFAVAGTAAVAVAAAAAAAGAGAGAAATVAAGALAVAVATVAAGADAAAVAAATVGAVVGAEAAAAVAVAVAVVVPVAVAVAAGAAAAAAAFAVVVVLVVVGLGAGFGAKRGGLLLRSLSASRQPVEQPDGEEIITERKIIDVHQAIDEDKNACQGLQRNQNLLENCVADFAVFCRDHIDSVLSSELVEGEFGILLYILRGTHSPGAVEYARVPVLLDEEVNIHVTRVSTLMEQLERSASSQEASATIKQVLHNMKEGPNDEEIRTMTMKFIEAKFAKACKSEL